MLFTRTTSLLIVSTALTTLAAGCVSSTTGEEGNLSFRYSSPNDARNFNKPIAVGAKLDVRVYAAGTVEPGEDDAAEIVSASAGDSAVFTVSNGGGNTIIVEGVGAGSSELLVTATVAGEEVSDRVTMMARVPEVLKLTHLCGDPGRAVGFYLVGQEIDLGFGMELSDGQQMIGYGYYPIDVEPTAGATLKTDSRDQTFVKLTTGAEAGQVTLSSRIDATTMTLNLVEEGAINAIALEAPVAVAVDEQEIYTLLPSVQGSPVCQARVAFTVTTTTPDICDVTALSDTEFGQAVDALTRKLNWIQIEGKTVGDCAFDVTLPNASGGAGLTTSLQVSVEAAP